MIEPLLRRSISPFHGWYSRKRWAMIASPAEAVRTALFKPIIPREGILNSRCIRSFLLSIIVISPLRFVTISIIRLDDSSGRLIVSCSTGSHFTPSISLMITCGWPTCNSYPSRRIVSINTDKWSTPRPYTNHESAESVGTTRNARFLSNSFCKRSNIWREVTNLPSLPKNGELLIVKSIDMVGSSIAIVGNASGSFTSAIVSPISKPSIPITAQISPDWTEDTFVRPKPSNTSTSLIFDFTIEPSRLHNITSWPSFSSPRWTRPTAIRPTYFEKSSEVISIWGVPSSTFGSGIYSIIASNNARISSFGSFQSVDIHPCFAEP